MTAWSSSCSPGWLQRIHKEAKYIAMADCKVTCNAWTSRADQREVLTTVQLEREYLELINEAINEAVNKVNESINEIHEQ